MPRRWLLLAAGCLVLTPAGACGSEERSPPSAAATAPRAAGVDGAMCAEHGVLEAVCTLCNPKLVPVFKAKGDWCEEHGLPESFCPICRPERGGRPAADVSDDAAPAHGTKIQFKTQEIAAQAGIQTVPAVARPGGAHLQALATIAYDATRHAQINARAPGVIKRIAVDVGARVAAGDLLAVVESAAVNADRSRVRAAATRVEVAQAAFEREQSLHRQGISPEKDVLEARRVLEEAKADLAAAQGALGMVGASEGGAGTYQLRAPIAGTVTRRTATIGHLAQTDEVLFEVVDTRSMWGEIDLPEQHVAQVREGVPATIILDALPGREWQGAIAYVAPEIDPKTRTARARLALANPDGLLRANMYGRATVPLDAGRTSVMVPREAVQHAGGAALVFVKQAADRFETRRVKLGVSDGALIEILDGVEAGEPVATTGSFLLKTETLKGSIGAGCCEVE